MTGRVSESEMLELLSILEFLPIPLNVLSPTNSDIANLRIGAPKASKIQQQPTEKMDVDDEDEASMIKRMMGFSKFKTTKNTKIPGNEYQYGVRREKQTVYRQYMNRTGGFNRPLSPPR